MLAKLDTFSAALLATCPWLSMLWLDALSVRAVVVIVIHVPMRGRIFFRVRVVWAYSCHSSPQCCLRLYVGSIIYWITLCQLSVEFESSFHSFPGFSARKPDFIRLKFAWLHCPLAACSNGRAGILHLDRIQPRFNSEVRSEPRHKGAISYANQSRVLRWPESVIVEV